MGPARGLWLMLVHSQQQEAEVWQLSRVRGRLIELWRLERGPAAPATGLQWVTWRRRQAPLAKSYWERFLSAGRVALGWPCQGTAPPQLRLFSWMRSRISCSRRRGAHASAKACQLSRRMPPKAARGRAFRSPARQAAAGGCGTGQASTHPGPRRQWQGGSTQKGPHRTSPAPTSTSLHPPAPLQHPPAPGTRSAARAEGRRAPPARGRS